MTTGDVMDSILADVETSIHSIFDSDPRGEDLTKKIRQIFQYHLPDLLSSMMNSLLTPRSN